jgi:hypothetical protein
MGDPYPLPLVDLFLGKGSSGQKGKAVDLSAEVSGRTKSGITGRVNVGGDGFEKMSTELLAEVR